MSNIKQVLTSKIVASYPTAKVFHADSEWYIQAIWKRGLLGLTVGNQEFDNDKIGVWCEADKCQIILNPLSEISYEDLVELLKIASYHPQIKDDWENIICDLCVDKIIRLSECIKVKHSLICFEGYFCIGTHKNMALHFEMQDENEEPEKSGVWQSHRLIDFLRSKSYDCGYGDIPSLINAGIAISAPNVERSVATK